MSDKYWLVFEYENGKWEQRTTQLKQEKAWAMYEANRAVSGLPVAVVSVKGVLALYSNAKRWRVLEYSRDTTPDMLRELLEDPKPKPLRMVLINADTGEETWFTPGEITISSGTAE